MSAAAALGELLSSDEAKRLAASLSMQGLVHQAVKSIAPGRRDGVKALLLDLVDECGPGSEGAVAVLRALASVPQGARPQLVWTSPSLPGVEGHTTMAVSALINEAESHVYAATYSATKDSPYITALAAAYEQIGRAHV